MGRRARGWGGERADGELLGLRWSVEVFAAGIFENLKEENRIRR
jgi:hypothetical protein